MARPNIKREEAIKILKENNCNIIDYNGIYICFEDENGYKYKKDYYKILKNGFSLKEKYSKINPYNLENIMLDIKDNNENNSIPLFYNNGELKIKCGVCGNIFTRKYKDFIRSKHKVCDNCYKIVHKTKIKEIDSVKKEVEKYGFVPMFESYNGIHSKLDIMDSDGYKGSVCLVNIRKGSKISKFAKYNKFAIENIRRYCFFNDFNCTIPEQKYKGWDYDIKVICKCGREFLVNTTHLIDDNQFLCAYCSKSKSANEQIIENWLKANGINYEMQYKFNDCFYKGKLLFDFYLKEYNIAIEVDGEQHYRPVMFSGNIEKSKEQYEEIKIRDKIKNDYCKNNNIKLIRISYKEINNKKYKNILSSNIH